jgi:uncharacterized Zn-binding protein involved in type VI secretion
MPTMPAAFMTSMTQHGSPISVVGSPNVEYNGHSAWLAEVPWPCPQHGPEIVHMASETVEINGKRAARVGDFFQGSGAPDRIMVGSPNVDIGTPPIGTAGPDGVAAFCKLYCDLKKDWANLTPAQRQARYNALLAAMFGRFGAPPPTSSASTPAGSQAAFDQNNWQVLVAQNAFTNNAGPPDGGPTFHEIRHGEQSFMGARQRGGQNLGARQPPASVVASAQAQPLSPDSPEARYGGLMGDEYYSTAGNAMQNATIQNLTTTFTQQGAASAAYAAAYQAYYDRPTGQDSQTVEVPGQCGGCP